MQYNDFASADPANAPLDGPLFFGAEPVFWLAVLAVVVAVAVIAWVMGRNAADRTGDAAPGIWKAIDEVLRDAMQAHDGVLLGKAQDVVRVIESRLGRTLAVAKGMSGPLDTLRKAARGAAASRPSPTPTPTPPPGAPGPRDGDANAASPASAASASAANTVTIVNVGPSSGGTQPPPPPPNPREQLDAMRLAIAALNQHWLARAERIAELRAAHDELSGH